MMSEGNVLYAFALTAVAGLSTGIGGVISLFAKKTNTRFLTAALGLSAGVMVYISFVEMMPAAADLLNAAYGSRMGGLYAILAFFGGMLLIGVIDGLVPHEDNPHEAGNWQVGERDSGERLKRAGILTALAVGIHNFPEGIATFVSALRDPTAAIAIVAAIAIHNIPEGIAVATPIYHATGSKKKALLWSFLSGMAEPLGALMGWLILMPFMSDALYGILFAAISGIMIFISFDELLPNAQQYGEHHVAIGGVITGMAIMAVSLVMFL
ncbi:MAG: zinc transporter ZupT [Eubacteriales bacterium]|jgi:ZIP family zinc transporter|nr:zinc transporter ZupT [Eubacteriales bacterium]MDD4105391.1 zinc transporter ZupT [Eubacteriales bacterium]MDD4709882.1 zinc transporter ZupT [Eubacteriales bacterium]